MRAGHEGACTSVIIGEKIDPREPNQVFSFRKGRTRKSVKVLVVGNGGREHALAWKLLQSKQIEKVVCVPGNGGTASMERCQNLPLAVDDFDGMSRYALEHGISLVIVGPEVPLSKGITDYLQDQGLMVFGPVRAGAQIEASKAWAKALMQEAGIPTARAAVFTEAAAAKSYVKSQGAPIVVKADGLAAGKGVTVAETVAQAESAVDAIFRGQFGSAGEFVVIEECLIGQEVSVLALTDGLTIRPLLPAQDHKRIGEGDIGENTGGMGAYCPAPIATPELMARIQTEVLERAIATLRAKSFGDPETQVILPLLETPLEELILACVQQRLSELPPIAWKGGASATVVAASGGYPGEYERGLIITGISDAEATGSTVFHAGTKLNQQQEIVTDGGRVLNVTGIGENFEQAIAQAYAAIKYIQFEGIYYRRDIGHKVVGAKQGDLSPD
jgi:phosphoribosylamine--glycine ligase